MTRACVVALASAVMLTACGGGVASPAAPSKAFATVAEVQEAARSTVDKGTAEILFSISFDGSSSIASGTRLHGSGVTTFGRETRQALQMDMDSVGLGILEFIVDGSDLYIRGQITESMGIAASKWLYIDLTSESDTAMQFASVVGGDNDASLLVYYLLGAKGDVTDLGAQELDAVTTQHVGLTVDLDLALANVPEDARAALVANIAEWKANGVDREMNGEAWIGSDGLVRRVSYTVQLSDQSGGGLMSTVVDLTQIGVAFDLDIPSDSETVALDDL